MVVKLLEDDRKILVLVCDQISEKVKEIGRMISVMDTKNDYKSLTSLGKKRYANFYKLKTELIRAKDDFDKKIKSIRMSAYTSEDE